MCKLKQALREIKYTISVHLSDICDERKRWNSICGVLELRIGLKHIDLIFDRFNVIWIGAKYLPNWYIQA